MGQGPDGPVLSWRIQMVRREERKCSHRAGSTEGHRKAAGGNSHGGIPKLTLHFQDLPLQLRVGRGEMWVKLRGRLLQSWVLFQDRASHNTFTVIPRNDVSFSSLCLVSLTTP